MTQTEAQSLASHFHWNLEYLKKAIYQEWTESKDYDHIYNTPCHTVIEFLEALTATLFPDVTNAIGR